MLVGFLVLIAIALTVAWLVSEFRDGLKARIFFGFLLVASACASIWALKDLELRVHSFWISRAFEEVSAQVQAGNSGGVQQAIARYLDKTQHDPSSAAAVELIHELNPDYGKGVRE